MEELELKVEINNRLESLFADFVVIKAKYSEPEKLSRYEYVWLVFSCNVYFQTKDMLLIIKDHEGKTEKVKTSIYAIFRSILEDYFYLKLLTSDKNKIETHLQAFIGSSQENNRKNLQALLDLESIGKYIPTLTGTVTSLEGLKEKITQYKKYAEIVRNGTSEERRLMNIYSNTSSVCKEYDKVNGIVKITEKQEHKSLVWLYGFIYRFTSGAIHQVLESKEPILDLLWYNKTYTAENKEVLGLLLVILDDVKSLNK